MTELPNRDQASQHPTEGLRRPVSQLARDRLRNQARRERDLAAQVAAAEARLAAERKRRQNAIGALDRAIARRESEVADALITYVDTDGVGIERAAIILGRAKTVVARMVRTRRAELRSMQGNGQPDGAA